MRNQEHDKIHLWVQTLDFVQGQLLASTSTNWLPLSTCADNFDVSRHLFHRTEEQKLIHTFVPLNVL